MKIAVLSDTHNQEARTRRALEQFRERGAEMVLHCGDVEDPHMVGLFRGWTAHFVLGNCDTDIDALADMIQVVGGTLHERFGHLEIAGKQIAFLHGHQRNLLQDLIRSEAYDYLFHGHTHLADDRWEGRTRVINPGALHRAMPKTCIVIDPATGEKESFEVI